MPWFTWNDSLECGIKAIDDQHRQLVELGNQLKAAVDAGQGHEILDRLFGELAGYAVRHFATEDAVMAAHRVATAADHQLEHQQFLEKVQSLASGSTAGASVHLEALSFLKYWLVLHIHDTDIRTFKPLADRVDWVE